jgi:hypothetical protein
MLGPGIELEQIRRALTDARRAREAATCCGPSDPHRLPPLLKSIAELIEITELLLAERMKMESRLHRTPFTPPPDAVQPMSRPPDHS